MRDQDRKRLEYRPNLQPGVNVYTKYSVDPIVPTSAGNPANGEKPADNVYKEPDLGIPGYEPMHSMERDARRQIKKERRAALKARTQVKSTGTASNIYKQQNPGISDGSNIPLEEKLAYPTQPALSESVKAYSRYNVAEMMREANEVARKAAYAEKKIRDRLAQDGRFADYPQALRDNDISLIDKYANMAENRDGDIYAEIYPVVYALNQELSDLMEKVNALEFDGKLDWFNIDKAVEDEDNKRRSIEKAESDGNPVDYKAISMTAQIGKFVEDRVNLLGEMLEDLANPSLGDLVALPDDQELVEYYYDEVEVSQRRDKDKMMSFQSTGVINDLLTKLAELKPKVLKNRGLLASADQDEFFKILPIAKSIEDRYTGYIVDLYKSQTLDEIYKADYINSLRLKHSIRSVLQ